MEACENNKCQMMDIIAKQDDAIKSLEETVCGLLEQLDELMLLVNDLTFNQYGEDLECQ